MSYWELLDLIAKELDCDSFLDMPGGEHQELVKYHRVLAIALMKAYNAGSDDAVKAVERRNYFDVELVKALDDIKIKDK